jgi:ectoine hydroxylase-related dioxygenase (phytanoyl-CoA dioxygenase family)
MVREEQIMFFENNGYLKYGKVLEKDEVEELIEGLNRVIRIELEGGDGSSVEFSFGHYRKGDQSSNKPRAIHQYVNMWKRDKNYEMWKRDKNYEKTIKHPLIAGTAKALLRTPTVRLWHDQIISKPPKDNEHFRFHQDFYFWPLSEPRILSCWLALDDSTVENGCMHVIVTDFMDIYSIDRS